MLWGISEMVNARAFKPLPLCSAPLQILLAVICGALGTQESHLSKQICLLRKCCRVSQKWWMLELANLCHCVQYPSHLLVGIFLELSEWQKATLSAKMCFEKMLQGISGMVNARACNLCHCVQYPSTLTSRHFSGALGTQESHFVSKNVFWENAAGYLRNGEC